MSDPPRGALPRPALPDYTARAMRLDDLPAVLALLDRDAQRWTGEPYFPASDYERELQEPGFDLDLDTTLLLDGAGRAAGIAEVHAAAPFTRAICWVRVDPEHEGRGLGSRLTQWAVSRAAARVEGAPPGERALAVCETVSTHRAAAALLAGHGFAPLRTFIRMKAVLDRPPVEPAWPPGIAVRTMELGADDVPLYLAYQDAFRDHWDHTPASFEEGLAGWRHALFANPSFDPSLTLLAVAAETGSITGFAICTPPERPGGAGFVLELGVRRPWRRQGLARALLLHAFGVLRGRGVAAVALNVDAESLTGANRLYESVGMAVHFRNDLYALDLGGGDPT